MAELSPPAKHSKKNTQPKSRDTLPGRGRALRDREAAEVLGVSVSTLPAWRCRNQGPRFACYGRAIRYFEADLLEYVETCMVDPAGGDL